MKKINFGVIGCASRGRLARLVHQPDRGLILKAAVDIDEESIQEFKGWAEKVGHKDYIITKDYQEKIKEFFSFLNVT